MTTISSPTAEMRPTVSLRPNPLNPRGELHPAGLDELADSIRAQGVLQPLLVTPDGVVVAGHRRLAAARQAGLAEVPVLVRDLDRARQQEIMLVENLQRQDLSPVEEARAYRGILDEGHTTAQLARRIGVPAARINARLLHRAHATVVVDRDTDAVLQHADAETTEDSSLAVQRQVLQGIRSIVSTNAEDNRHAILSE